jgi:hypothetical protein
MKSMMPRGITGLERVKPFMSKETLKKVYYAYFHSIMGYGLTFFGNYPHSANTFKIEKTIIRITTG